MQQQELIAGTTLSFATSVPEYPASAGWTLKYYLRRRDAVGAIDLTADADGDDYRVEVAAATTAAWPAATYGWESRAEKGTEKYPVASGQIVVLPDIATSTGAYDSRSKAEQALEAVDAMMLNKASSAQRRYRIGERELESYGVTELLALRSHLAIQVKRERRAQALAEGRPDPAKTYVRINRA